MKKVIKSSKDVIKSFECPLCGNHTLYDVDNDVYNPSFDVDYHDLFVCEECGNEVYSEPRPDGTIKFVYLDDEDEW